MNASKPFTVKLDYISQLCEAAMEQAEPKAKSQPSHDVVETERHDVFEARKEPSTNEAKSSD